MILFYMIYLSIFVVVVVVFIFFGASNVSFSENFAYVLNGWPRAAVEKEPSTLEKDKEEQNIISVIKSCLF